MADQSTYTKRNKSALDPSSRLRVGYLLTLAGGSLDAYTFFARGGVFANAQTGNIVLLAVALAEGDGNRAMTYLVPIVSFIMGLVAALLLDEGMRRRDARLARRASLVIEVVGLLAVALIPATSTGNAIANSIVSFVAAIQYEAFKSFRGHAFATTMTTGNLRKFVEGAFGWMVCGNEASHHQMMVFGSVILTFVTGAVIGASAGKILGTFGCVPAMVLLTIAGIVITLMKR